MIEIDDQQRSAIRYIRDLANNFSDKFQIDFNKKQKKLESTLKMLTQKSKQEDNQRHSQIKLNEEKISKKSQKQQKIRNEYKNMIDTITNTQEALQQINLQNQRTKKSKKKLSQKDIQDQEQMTAQLATLKSALKEMERKYPYLTNKNSKDQSPNKEKITQDTMLTELNNETLNLNNEKNIAEEEIIPIQDHNNQYQQLYVKTEDSDESQKSYHNTSYTITRSQNMIYVKTDEDNASEIEMVIIRALEEHYKKQKSHSKNKQN